MNLYIFGAVGIVKVAVNALMAESVIEGFGEGQEISPLEKRQRVISFWGRARPNGLMDPGGDT